MWCAIQSPWKQCISLKKKKQTKEKEREEQKYFLQKKKIAFVLDVEVK